MCGGTLAVLAGQLASVGLSPRVRGNLDLRFPPCGQTKVYPRVCGGTLFAHARPTHQYGLSPRVRGNLPSGVASVRFSGSIPACAGEPVDQLNLWDARGVYPRVCGGTPA